MENKDIFEAILGSLNDLIVVKDDKGNICYQNHFEINPKTFLNDTKVEDEFYDEKTKNWYKLDSSSFYLKGSKFFVKKYSYITKSKMKLSILEIDGKTGLLRIEPFKEKIEYLSKIGKDIVLAIIDIDYFKNINDNFGHEVGDEVLKKIGALIKSLFRSKDLLGRFGGDELIFALIDIDINVALQKLELLRKLISENIILSNEDFRHSVTISGGYVKYDNTLTYKENLVRADKALYLSKENGKNQINIYDKTKIKKMHLL